MSLTYAYERLVHFSCGLCSKWWSIGDAPYRNHWFCPWCGVKHELKADIAIMERTKAKEGMKDV